MLVSSCSCGEDIMRSRAGEHATTRVAVSASAAHHVHRRVGDWESCERECPRVRRGPRGNHWAVTVTAGDPHLVQAGPLERLIALQAHRLALAPPAGGSSPRSRGECTGGIVATVFGAGVIGVTALNKRSDGYSRNQIYRMVLGAVGVTYGVIAIRGNC